MSILRVVKSVQTLKGLGRVFQREVAAIVKDPVTPGSGLGPVWLSLHCRSGGRIRSGGGGRR